jgi:hypothetical protein
VVQLTILGVAAYYVLLGDKSEYKFSP